MSETVTCTAVPTDAGAEIDISYGNASADPSTFTHVENPGEVALYTIGANISRLVLIQVGSGSDAQTYQIAVTVRPDL